MLSNSKIDNVTTGNLSSTQPATIDYLKVFGVEVHAEATIDANSHNKSLARTLNRGLKQEWLLSESVSLHVNDSFGPEVPMRVTMPKVSNGLEADETNKLAQVSFA